MALSRSQRLKTSRSARRRALTLDALEDRTVLSFLPASTFPVGVQPREVTVGDFNNDGKPDLAVVNSGPFSTFQSSVSVLLGNGNGSFQPAVTTNVRNSGQGTGIAGSAAVGDFNGDRLLDVALNTAGPAGPAVEVLLGKGDGSFRPDPLILGVGQTPLSLAAADFDGNRTLDLVTANSQSGTISVLLGRGDGTFQPRVDLAVGGAPRAVAIGDFNGDGRLDVATAQQLSDTVSVLLGHGDGTFARPLAFAASGQDFTPSSLAVSDVNGDGRSDLVINSISFLDSDAFQVGVLLGRGDGTFQAPRLGAAQPGGSGDLALGDFNNDGRLDVAVADQLGAASGNLSVFAGNGDGTFQSLIRLDLLTGGDDPEGVAAADLNGDGLVDLVAANASSSTVGVLLNSSTGTVAAPTTTTLRTSTATAVFGQRVTLLAEVTSEFVPTGTVTFRDGTTVLGTVPVDDSGQAPLTVSLGVGNHALTASFVGTGGFADSSSAVAAVTVNRAATAVSLASSLNPAVAGQAVTFKAGVSAVAPGAGTPTGTVTFKDGTVVLGTVAVGIGGRASLTTSFAVAGGHVVTAVYNGDPNFAGGSQSLTEQVNQAATTGITVSFSAGTLRVAGDDLDNTIVISRDAAGTILINNGAIPLQGVTVANTSLILLNGGAGNDNLSLNEANGALPLARLGGGNGNDVLTAGSAGDVLDGAGGNDTLLGGAGDDTFAWSPGDGSDVAEGRGGRDLMVVAGSDVAEKFTISDSGVGLPSHRVRLTRDVGGVTLDLNGIEDIEINAGGGADTVTVNDLTATDILDVNLDLGARDGEADSVVINGTNGDDFGQIAAFDNGTRIGANVGTFPFVNILAAEATRDTLTVNALGGSDGVDASALPANLIRLIINGGAGNDTITGSQGNDTLTGGAGDDFIDGVAGNDVLEGGAGNDTLTGGAGNDIFRFDSDNALGSDAIDESGGGVDTLDFSATTTRAVAVNLGNAGAQAVNAGLTLTLSSGATIENVIGGALGDTLTGNALNNVIEGGGGNDTLTGGAGNDTYRFDTDLALGSDTVDESGGGVDTLDFSSTTTRAVAVNLGSAGAQAVNAGLTLTLSSGATIENVIGGALGDTLTGNALNNSLSGGGGNDVLAGGAGSDTLEGGAGNDALIGGAGNDTYRFDTDLALGSDAIDESGGGVDTLDFSATTTRAVNINLGSAAAQAVNAGLTLTLSSGATIENVVGGALGDTLTGNALNNSLSGGAGNDTLDGGAGTDTLDGGAGTDVGLDGEVVINIP